MTVRRSDDGTPRADRDATTLRDATTRSTVGRVWAAAAPRPDPYSGDQDQSAAVGNGPTDRPGTILQFSL